MHTDCLANLVSVCRCILWVPFDVILHLIPVRWKFSIFSVSWHLVTNLLFVMTICCIAFMSHGKYCLSFPTDFREERLWIRFLLRSFDICSLNDTGNALFLRCLSDSRTFALLRFFPQYPCFTAAMNCWESHKKLKGSKLLQKVQPAW